MYFKLAVGNVKKSYKDYAIYFLTLTLAVCIFYSFNSIESQKAFVEMTASGKQYAEMLVNIMSYVSLFVSIILGSLMLYANNFLIKKRNKELGTYMILGMSKNKISKILIIETLIVGVISLVSGLFLGLIVSQGLSVLVSKLFEIAVSEYAFIISTSAISKTILCFGIMFSIVVVFNTYVISRYKIIDLLMAGKKTEDIKFKNPIIYFIAFILCVISLGIAYEFILEIGLDLVNIKFISSIALGVVGTVLFFFSLSGVLLSIFKKTKRVYFKNLNLFVIKQMNSKVNTNFVAMSVICLMLFLTITILSTGLSFKQSLESGLKDATPYDASASMYIYEEDKIKSIEESLEKHGFTFDSSDEYVSFNKYKNQVKIKDLVPLEKGSEGVNFEVEFIKISDYNKIRKMNDENPIELKENEILISSNADRLLSSIKTFVKNNDKVMIKGQEYSIINDDVIEENLYTSFMKDNFFTVIINDQFCNDATLLASILNVNFSDENREQSKERFETLFASYWEEDFDYKELGFLSGHTREDIYMQSRSMTTTILFVGIYLGVIFLISSMAILALQQLSEASDSVDRYIALRRIGVSKASINKTIFTQTLIYFSIPIALALVHSAIGIKVADDFISRVSDSNMGMAILVTITLFLIIYSGYFYTTYTGYKNIVASKIK